MPTYTQGALRVSPSLQTTIELVPGHDGKAMQVFRAMTYPGIGCLPPPREAAENARRLVACWNACEGLSTGALEAMPAHFFGAVHEQRKLMAEQQRDELLAAIEQALKAEDDVFAPTVGTILRQARDRVLGD